MRRWLTELELLESAIGADRLATWAPHSPTERQSAFLSLTNKEALYGGAAGGGKSDALLMEALSDVDVPGYSAIIFRRTYQDLALPGALMDRAGEWLRPTAARWNAKDKQWTFPSGATLVFGYMDHDQDRYRYQGAEFQRICFDELTQFSEIQYRYLLSRLRRLKEHKVSLKVRSASNPGGRGHDWVKARFVDPGHPDRPFVPAKLDDNPYLDIDEYRQALAQLDDVTRQQLEMGIWVRDSGGLVYPYTDANLVSDKPAYGYGQWRYVLGVDLGATESKPTTAFCVVGWHTHDTRVHVFESHAHAGMTPHTIAAEINRLSGIYGGFTGTVIDEGALGKAYGKEFRVRYAIPCEPAEKPSKLGFRKLVRGALQRHEILIVRDTNDDLLAEMNSLAWNDAGTDNEKGADNHLTDALLYAWRKTRSFNAESPVVAPVPGSREALQAEADRIEEAEELAARTRNSGPWWR